MHSLEELLVEGFPLGALLVLLVVPPVVVVPTPSSCQVYYLPAGSSVVAHLEELLQVFPLRPAEPLVGLLALAAVPILGYLRAVLVLVFRQA